MLIGSVGVANEPRILASRDVFGKVVDVGRGGGCETVLFDGELIDLKFWLDVARLIGKDTACEVLENLVFS